ncbi:MAG: Arginyl-tRNA synthetase [uncultured bacterium (gcode 4)]|uniref:arginine--tRNA ligase n=1 Tax=uncultured bacterium (gcode 4) TaxID=1234023 RepID=K2GSP2_9BACT|nr:MAG: Arginyl-tRNA synthetase [uncultured bacterium (gcode 4)]
MVFDWDKALNFEWNSGPYIQYAYVRANKILDQTSFSWKKKFWDSLKISNHDKSLIKKLLEFDTKIIDTASKYKPHILAQYCYELASEFNSFYVHTPKILEEQNVDLKDFRLNLIKKTADMLKKWFELLAIDMPDEM